MIDYKFSIKGTADYNEDIIGHNGNVYWVFDGATHVFEDSYFPKSDPHFAVNRLSETMEVLSPERLSLESFITKAIEQTMADIQEEYPRIQDVPSYTLPSFTIVLVRLDRNNLEYLLLGDSSLVIENSTLLFDPKFSQKPLYSESKPSKLDGISDEGERLKILQEPRKGMNTNYWIGSLDARGIPHAYKGEVSIEEGQRIVLYTDGFEEYFAMTGDKPEGADFSPEATIQKMDYILAHSLPDQGKFKTRDDLSIISIINEGI